MSVPGSIQGGSKGIPRKYGEINNKPLITALSTQASLNSKYIDQTWVSSDDEEILIIQKN